MNAKGSNVACRNERETFAWNKIPHDHDETLHIKDERRKNFHFWKEYFRTSMAIKQLRRKWLQTVKENGEKHD